MSVVAQNIRVLMAKNNWRGKQVAAWLNISQPYLSRKLAGDVSFTIPNIVDFHENSGVPYEEILKGGEAQN